MQPPFAVSASGSFEASSGDAVSRILDALIDGADATIRSVAWSIAPSNPAHTEVRQDAVRAAFQTARDYADAAGLALGPLRALADPGLAEPSGPSFAMRTAAMGGGTPVSSALPALTPAPQQLRAAVHATFSLR
jgi:hypothetical protein